ncbi:hypothetical protein FRC08_013472, partial [Ceratobasidium sp. 394]
ATATHRVWQTLPRHLRRRAASHDVRRVPVRLREKAKFEIDPTKRKSFLKLLKRKKRLARESKRSEKFANRQKNKTWLETHLWHAKRMHMQDIWGYRLAIRPTEKSYRPSHRAAVHGSTLHDASYMGTIELAGQMATLVSVLKRCCDPCGVGPWATRYVSGVRICPTHLYEAGSWPKDLVAPVTVLWRPVMVAPGHKSAESSLTVQRPSADQETRTVWIRVHPASLKNAMESLKLAHKQVSTTSQLEIADLSGDVNAFELVGPRTSQVIHGAFRLAGNGREVGKFWETLANARSPGNFSPGMVIGLTVHDPRLHFPPTNTRVDGTGSEFMAPGPALAQSELWEQDVRDKLRTPAFKKAALDGRRSKNLTPGTRLRPTKEDDRIPIILIQHTVSAGHRGSPANHDPSQPMYGWTILLPPSWSMSFLNSLIHTGTRVVGLAAQHHQRLEANCPYFPEDYVGVPAFFDCTTRRTCAEQARWERTPKGKRVNYESLGIKHPWTSDWNGLTGAPSGTTEDLIPTDRSTNESHDRKSWLLLFPEAAELVKDMVSGPDDDYVKAFGDWINLQRTRRDMVPLERNLIKSLLDSALVHIRVDMLGRGNPKDRAIIYGFPTNEAASRWRASFESRSNGDEKSELASAELDNESIVGYITSGGYSLQAGHGHGIGAISLKYIVKMQRGSTNNSGVPSQIVRIRDLESKMALPAVVTML